MRTLTVCTLTNRLTEEIQRGIPSLRNAGFRILMGVTHEDTALEEYISDESLDAVSIPWNGNFSDAFNALFKTVEGDFVVRLDNDEWFSEEQAAHLGDLLRYGRPNLVGRLISRNIESLTSPRIYAETSVLRVWPAGAGIRYVGAVHERPLSEDIIRVTGCNDPDDLPVYYWHTGYALELRRGKAMRDSVAIKEILAKNPDSFFFRVMLASATKDLDPTLARRMFSECARNLANTLYLLERLPPESELVLGAVCKPTATPGWRPA